MDINTLHKQSMSLVYKKTLLETLSKHIVWLHYKNGDYIFDRPFRLESTSSSDKLESLMKSNSIDLIDCITHSPKTINFSDIIMFYNKNVSVEELQKQIDLSYSEEYKKYNFLKGKKLNDLLCVTPKNTLGDLDKKLIIRILDLIKRDDVYDYFAIKNNDKETMECLKKEWYNLILEKYNQTISSIDEEITNDESVKEELESIKSILQFIPNESKEELSHKITYKDIVGYWPILLLPKPDGYS
jgi:hypothetical protein